MCQSKLVDFVFFGVSLRLNIGKLRCLTGLPESNRSVCWTWGVPKVGKTAISQSRFGGMSDF